MDKLTKALRKLARSSYWQSLYRASKENGSISLFDNSFNFSGIQVRFLYWLKIYELLYEELGKHEDDFLSENVIMDDIRCDAYLQYRNKKHDYLWKKFRNDEKMAQVKQKHPGKFQGDNTRLINCDLRSE